MTVVWLNTEDLEVGGPLYGPKPCGECLWTINIADDGDITSGWLGSDASGWWGSGASGWSGGVAEVSWIYRLERRIGIAPFLIIQLSTAKFLRVVRIALMLEMMANVGASVEVLM